MLTQSLEVIKASPLDYMKEKAIFYVGNLSLRCFKTSNKGIFAKFFRKHYEKELSPSSLPNNVSMRLMAYKE